MDFSVSEQDKLHFQMRTLEFKINQKQNTLTDEDVTAKIHTGGIRGSKRLTIYNKPYYSFERIPYALPPIGELRFRTARPMAPWKDVRDCTWYGPKAMQRNPMDPEVIEGSEDCLYVNVYTNNLKPTKPRPVMVFVHGGGFSFGEGNREWYGPDYFMERDVILVTIQYRLGALGFLTLNDPSLQIPGNAGLKDIVLALKWVRLNARSFGGNPECVTLFGESAGAGAVHFMLVTEQTKNLFHRAILQSGVATGDWAISTNRTYELAKNAGYKGENKEKDILQFLRSLTAAEILDAESKCIERKDRELFAFAPCIEPYRSPHTVMDKPIEELLPRAWSNSIPIILGSNSFEGLFFERGAAKHEAHILKTMETCASYVPRHAARLVNSPEAEEKGMRLRKTHVQGDKPTIRDFMELISYSYYWHPIQKAIESRLKYAHKASTYLYRFDFNSNKLINPYRLMYSGDCGVAHTAELVYLFASVLAKPMECQSREYKCLQRMISLWTQFAETGNPNGLKTPVGGTKWHSLRPKKEKNANATGDGDGATFKCLNINDQLTFIDLPEMKKLKVWKSLYETQQTSIEETTKVKDTKVYAKSSM